MLSPLNDSGPVDFICIGAQRCGSTWLDLMLRQEANVWLPPLKEVHHFDRKSRRARAVSGKTSSNLIARTRSWGKELSRVWSLGSGANVDLSHARDLAKFAAYDLRSWSGIGSDRQYLELFDRAREKGLRTGEITPAYSLLDVDDVRRLHSVVGDVRVIMILRDPIDRMISHVAKDARGSSPLEFVRSAECRLRTDYAYTLRAWRRSFGTDGVRVVYFEDIENNPEILMAEIRTFLALPQSETSAVGRVNSHGASGSAAVSLMEAAAAEFALEQVAGLRALGEDGPYLEGWEKRAQSLLRR